MNWQPASEQNAVEGGQEKNKKKTEQKNPPQSKTNDGIGGEGGVGVEGGHLLRK